MKPTIHINCKRPRILNLRLKQAMPDDSDATTVATRPSPSGAFATLLVEWKQAQMLDVSEEVGEPKSA